MPRPFSLQQSSHRRPLSRRLDRCDRVTRATTSLATRTSAICVRFQGRRVRRAYVTMQITFLTRKSALIYRRGLRQRVASLTLNCNGDFAYGFLERLPPDGVTSFKSRGEGAEITRALLRLERTMNSLCH